MKHLYILFLTLLFQSFLFAQDSQLYFEGQNQGQNNIDNGAFRAE